MSRSELTIHGHSLVAAASEDHSVIRWRCLDCAREFDCVSECLANDCAPTVPSRT